MIEISEELRIARPPAEVWAVLADFDGISHWAPNVDHSCLTTDQDQGVGAVRRIQAGRNAVLERVVEWEPDRSLGYVIEGLPPVIRSVTNTWQLEPADGSANAPTTIVTLTSRIDAGPRPPQKVAARVVGRVLAKASNQMLGGLQQRVEEASP